MESNEKLRAEVLQDEIRREITPFLKAGINPDEVVHAVAHDFQLDVRDGRLVLATKSGLSVLDQIGARLSDPQLAHCSALPPVMNLGAALIWKERHAQASKPKDGPPGLVIGGGLGSRR